jgi:hypothetical protein
VLTFEGELLGSASSKRTSPRWSELRLYRTTAGTYVLEKVGRSTVVHVPGCPDILGSLPRFEDEHPGDNPDDYWYDDCVPEIYDITTLLVEKDRHWALIADDPGQVVDALYRRKDGARHLPRLSIELLDGVIREDEALANCYRVERIS